MARLPDERELGGLPGMSGQRAIGTPDATPIARGAAAIGEGVSALGKGISQLGAGIGEYQKGMANVELNENRFQYAKAKSGFIVDRAALDDRYLDDTDYATQPKRYQEELSKLRDKHADGIGAPLMRERFNSDTDELIGLSTLKQSRTAFHGTAKTELAKADDDIEAMRQAALRDPSSAPTVLAAVKDRMDTLVANKWIDPVAAHKYIKQFDEKYAIGKVSMLPPEQQIRMLQEPTRDKESWLDRTGGVENASGNPKERSKTSSAMGNFQFIKSTWLETLKNHRPDIAEGRSDAQLLELRGDPSLSREMAGHLYDANSAALKNAGLEATAGNLYLAHFAGAQGAINLLKAKPGTPAVDVLGQEAVDANRAVLSGKTAGSIVAWASGKMDGTPRGRGEAIDYIPEDKRQQLLMKAQTAVVMASRQTDSEIAQEGYTVKSLVTADLHSMAATGQGVDGLSEERIRNSLGSAAAAEWSARREDAHTVYLATADLTSLNEAQLAERVQQVQPQAGMKNFDRQAAIAKAVTDGANKVLKMRNEDPAGLFNTAPAVQKALEGVDRKKPETWGPVGKARLAEQEAAGVDPDNQTPITKAEAAALGVPLHRMIPGTERATVTQLGKDLRDMFGEDANKAFIYVMRQTALGEESRKVAGRVLRTLNLTPDDIARAEAERQAREAAERDAADKAVSGGWFGWLGRGVGPDMAPGSTGVGYTDKPEREKPSAEVNIPKGAIAELRANPDLAGEFNKKYGNGKDVAKDILKLGKPGGGGH